MCPARLHLADTVEPQSLIRPPSESHWCGRIRGMVAREGFAVVGIRIRTETTVRHTKCGRMRGMVVGEGGRSSGVLLYYKGCESWSMAKQ